MSNNDLKDLVYTENGWIEDYFLTAEKNQEIYDLREDLTQETLERKTQDTLFQETILANKKSADDAIIAVNQTIITEVNKLQRNIDQNNTSANNELTQLNKAIEDEVKTRTELGTELQTSIQALGTNLTNYKQEVLTTYATKEESETLHTELSNSITDLDTNLRQEIANQVLGSNKWVTESPVETLEALNALELGSDFNWLCRVTSEDGYTYQRIANSTEWKLYSKNEDYIDPTELETSLNSHDINNKAHTDIRASITALTEVVDGLSGGTATDLTELRSTVNTLESNFTTFESSTTQKLTETETSLNEIEGQIDQFVIKVEGKDLSTNDYTDEDKEKVSQVTPSLYEKAENKVINLAEANDITYPTSLAVRTYVDDSIPDLSKLEALDFNNLVLKDGEPQFITTGTTFSNFAIANAEFEDISNNLSTDIEGNLIIEKGLKTNDLYFSNLIYRDKEYTIWEDGQSEEDYILPSIGYVRNLISQSFSNYDITSILANNQTVTKADYIIYNTSDLNLINTSLYTSAIYCGTLTEGEISYTGGILYNYIDNNWTIVKMIDSLFYSLKIIDTNHTIKEQFTLCGVTKVNESTYQVDQIYPVTNIDLADYVTNTSLTNTLNNYVTTNNLTTTLNTYATTASLNTLSAKVSTLENKGFLTSIPSEYITETELTAKGYATSSALNLLTNRVSTLETTGGQEGPQGPAGAAAGFGTTTGTVTMASPSTSPSVSVTTSGDNTAKNFTFAFTLPKAATFTYSGTTLTITTT